MQPDATECYDTGAVPPEARIGYWGETISRLTAPVTFAWDGLQELRCTLTSGAFERFSFAHAVTSEISVFRGKEHVRSACGMTYLYLQLEGTGELVALGRTERTGPGTIILFDDSTPYRFKALSPVRTLSVGLPVSLLEARLPGYRDLAMRPLDGDVGIHQVLQAALRSMDALFVERPGLRFPRAMFLGLIEMLAATVEEIQAAESGGTLDRWAAKIRAHVEANLDDPDLTPSSIAATFAISPRYLRLIFASGGEESGAGETLRRFILRRRLEECARRLAERVMRAPSITHLAHGWGFSDSSYFARRFVEYYGTTPRAYRAARLREDVGV